MFLTIWAKHLAIHASWSLRIWKFKAGSIKPSNTLECWKWDTLRHEIIANTVNLSRWTTWGGTHHASDHYPDHCSTIAVSRKNNRCNSNLWDVRTNKIWLWYATDRKFDKYKYHVHFELLFNGTPSSRLDSLLTLDWLSQMQIKRWWTLAMSCLPIQNIYFDTGI